MSEPIRIIVNGPRPEMGSLHDNILITPDLARQIVTMAGIPRLDNDFIISTDERIAALESRLAEPTPAPQQRSYSLSEAVRKPGYPTQITNPHDLDPGAWAKGSAAAGAQPVDVDPQTQGDDAAERALTAVIGWGSACDPSLAGHAARMVLQEIRCGKVPGVFISGQSLAGQDRSRILKELNAANIDDGIAAIVSLRAQLAEAETSRDSYHKAACNHKAREEDCWRERDRLSAQVEGLTRENESHIKLVQEQAKVISERNAALEGKP